MDLENQQDLRRRPGGPLRRQNPCEEWIPKPAVGIDRAHPVAERLPARTVALFALLTRNVRTLVEQRPAVSRHGELVELAEEAVPRGLIGDRVNRIDREDVAVERSTTAANACPCGRNRRRAACCTGNRCGESARRRISDNRAGPTANRRDYLKFADEHFHRTGFRCNMHSAPISSARTRIRCYVSRARPLPTPVQAGVGRARFDRGGASDASSRRRRARSR